MFLRRLQADKACNCLQSLCDFFGDPSYAPLLCAGLIGYRAYHMILKHAENIGFYGFDTAANLLIQLAIFEQKKVYAFTSKGDIGKQKSALLLFKRGTLKGNSAVLVMNNPINLMTNQ